MNYEKALQEFKDVIDIRPSDEQERIAYYVNELNKLRREQQKLYNASKDLFKNSDLANLQKALQEFETVKTELNKLQDQQRRGENTDPDISAKNDELYQIK